ncbi:MAG: transketolase C-terminal domain-containing protein, partial [Nannocystaceae bacterium]
MTVLDALARLCAELLRDDPRRVIVGEDVATGGLLGLTRAAADDEALAPRLIGAPLVPAAALAHAGGLALAGLRPLVILPSATALLEGYAALRELARLRVAGGGERSAPVVVLAPAGPGFGLGGDGADPCEDPLCAVPGLRVIALGGADEAVAAVRAAAAIDVGDPPTVLLLPRALLVGDAEDDDLAAPLGRPLGAARRRREGAACTVFAWGGAVAIALAAADAAASEGHDAQVVDLGGLAPLDADGIAAAAARTG